MTIGGSIYSFALILVTFLIGIAAGSAALSAFLGGKAKPFLGIAVTAIALVALANIPWLVDLVDPRDTSVRKTGSVLKYTLITLLYSAPIALAAIFVIVRTGTTTLRAALFGDSMALWRPVLTVVCAAIPVVAALINTITFPGHLPLIILSVVASVAVFLVLASLLSRTPILLIAIIQLFIAGATVVSYVWQDEIPYAFAQLVASIPSDQLPDHVLEVRLFSGLTIMLCTLPSTLGMGAMFPLTVRLWTAGGAKIAEDVAVVYTGNTIGSIIGSWLPGFILFALIGAEKTLHLGVALNMVLALVLLIVGAADPEEDQSWWTWRRLSAIALPFVAAIAIGVTVTTIDTEDWRWWLRMISAGAFVAVGFAEHAWLGRLSKRDDESEEVSMELVAASVAVPLIASVTLAFFMLDVGEHAPWAEKAVYVALRALVIAVGAGGGVGKPARVGRRAWRIARRPRVEPERAMSRLELLRDNALAAGLTFAVALTLSVALLYFLQRIYAVIPKRHRDIEPTSVWLLLIPLFNLYWGFVVYRGLGTAFMRYFDEQGEPVGGPERLKLLGTVLAIGGVLGPRAHSQPSRRVPRSTRHAALSLARPRSAQAGRGAHRRRR